MDVVQPVLVDALELRRVVIVKIVKVTAILHVGQPVQSIVLTIVKVIVMPLVPHHAIGDSVQGDVAVGVRHLALEHAQHLV